MTQGQHEPELGATPTSAQDGYNIELGARVRQALVASGKTQMELAVALGIDQASVNRRLMGRIAWKASDVTVVAELLGLDVADLMAPEAAAS